MIAGHYATALIPHALVRKGPRAPLWMWLVAAQFTDFLMLVLVQLGLEQLKPTNFLDMSFHASSSDMWLSHDLLPSAGWAVVVGLFFGTLAKSRVVGLWCAALVVLHEACDLVVGYTHHWMGPETGAFGLNLYQNAPYVGLLIEAAFCFALVTWFCWHRKASGQAPSLELKLGLHALLTGSALANLVIASRSINQWLGIITQ